MPTEQRKIELAEMANVMRTGDGRRVIARMLKTFGVQSSTFNADPHLHSYQAGRRDAGLHIEAEAREADLPLYLKLITEMNDNGRT